MVGGKEVKKNRSDNFECPVCHTYMSGHIMQCVTGHSICLTCKKKLKSCPFCKKEFLKTRNFSLERMVKNNSNTSLKMASHKMLLEVKKNCYDSFQCPVCWTYMTGHIMQCVTGHSICPTCKEKLESCPLCKMDFSQTRNFSLECLAENIGFPCKNSEDGCKETIFLKDTDKHEKCCPYRQYKCLAGRHSECKWQGKKEEILEHVSKSHIFFVKVLSNKNVFYHDLSNGQNAIACKLLSAYGELFWLQSFFSSLDKVYYVSVHYIGHLENCSNFFYKLHFISSSSKNNGLTFSMETHPDSVELKDLIEGETECFSMKWNLVKQFTHRGTLRYEFGIVKVV